MSFDPPTVTSSHPANQCPHDPLYRQQSTGEMESIDDCPYCDISRLSREASAALDLLGTEAIRVCVSGEPEDLAASLALTCAKLAKRPLIKTKILVIISCLLTLLALLSVFAIVKYRTDLADERRPPVLVDSEVQR
jgi:hypothetical protein